MIVEKKQENIFEVENYTFQNLSETNKIKNVISYDLKDLSDIEFIKGIPEKKVIETELKKSQEIDFNIDPIVKKYRKILDVEHEQYEEKIEQKVVEKVSIIKKESQEDGYQKGLELGQEEAIQKLGENIDSYLNKLNLINEEILNSKADIIKTFKKDIVNLMIKTMKWVCKKEISKDDNYLEKIFEQMMNEYNLSENLVVYLSPRDIMKFPQILEHYESNTDGKNKNIKNIKFEKREDLIDDEIIIESENLLVSATDEDIYQKIKDAYDKALSDE